MRWPEPGAALPRDATVAAVGPPSGSTVEPADPPEGPQVVARSPARLVHAEGEHQLAYGRNRIEGLELELGREALLSTRSPTPVCVEGERLVGGRRLRDGDRITRAGRLVTFRLAAPLDPPPPTGPTRLHLRTPRHVPAHVPAPIDLPTPPSPGRLPGLPVVSAVVPLLMGAALWFATGSVLAAGFMLFSTVFVVAAGVEARREARAERRFRVEEFRADLADAAAAASASRRAQHARLDETAPRGDAVARLVEEQPERIWERLDGSLAVRVGDGAVAAEDEVRPPTSGRRELRDDARAVAASHSPFVAPLVVDLGRHGGVAVVGPDETPAALVRSILVQLVASLTPGQVSVEVVTGPGREHTWRWCTWLPHCSATRATGTRLRVVDGVPGWRDEGDGPVLWVGSSAAGVPESIGAVVDLGGARGTAHLDLRDIDGTWTRTSVERTDLLDLDDASAVGRRLSALDWQHDAPAGVDPGEGLRGVLEDPELLTEAARVVAAWAGAPRHALGAPVGWAGDAVAHLDLRADGPHALVAGTTGSGKSELLRTLICSLALHHPPDRLSFLLVDYKGGAAFGPVVDLPHVAGMITDLAGQLAPRALVALRAELRRRERVLAGHGASDLDELRSIAPEDAVPSLVVVVDEFATLARELPEFVDGLVDVAQRGRSLGIHLVLATQRPAGVVTDNIRANTSLRIALRVADPDESRDVVEVGDAAQLPRDQPGAAVVRLGPDATTQLRFAHTGAPASRPPRIRTFPLGAPPRPDPGGTTGRTQLHAVVDTVTEAARHAGLGPSRRPWIEPLPDLMCAGELRPDEQAGQLSIGWVDRPDQQRRDVLRVDLAARNGLVVTGAGGSGRTTVVRALALAAARHRRERVHLRVISSAPTTGTRADDGRTDALLGDVVEVGDVERVLRLLRSLTERSPDTRTVLVVDGLAEFLETYERLRHCDAIGLLHRLAREGPRRGHHVVVTTGRRSEVPSGLASALGASIHLRSANEDDALLAGLDPTHAAPAVPPGRCSVDGQLCQIAFPEGVTVPAGWSPPAPVPRLPELVTVRELGGAPLLDADALRPLAPDPQRHVLVAGPPGSGVSSFLHVLASLSSGPTTVLGAPHRDHDVVSKLSEADGTLVVDDLPALLDSADHGNGAAAALAGVLASGHARIIAGGEIDALLRCYDDVVTRLRSLRHGVLLGVDPELHATLLHAEIPPRPDLPAGPGRGWLVTPDATRAVAAAVLDPTPPR